jgi:hypothetical protein
MAAGVSAVTLVRFGRDARLLMDLPWSLDPLTIEIDRLVRFEQ